MTILIEPLTGLEQVQRAASLTRQADRPRNATAPLSQWYAWRHSPIRARIFWIELRGIRTDTSVHLVRHKIGVEHYVSTNRDDRGAAQEARRSTLINHGMLINAEALINMSHKRLCYAAHRHTVATFQRLRRAMRQVDPDLHAHLVPECAACGYCPEPRECPPGLAAVLHAYRASAPVQARARSQEPRP